MLGFRYDLLLPASADFVILYTLFGLSDSEVHYVPFSTSALCLVFNILYLSPLGVMRGELLRD